MRPAASDLSGARDRAVSDLAARCHFEEPHATAVQRLALALFDALHVRLELGPDDRRLLAEAALLHDIGYHISFDGHHKHSYHLILHAELPGMTPPDQVVVANVARYHRGAAPKRKHENYGTLDREMRRRIKRLAALLRLADGFDRGHVGAVASLDVRTAGSGEEERLRITPRAARRGEGLRLETWGALRKAALLGDVLKMPIEIESPDGTVASTAESLDEVGEPV